MCPATVSYTHLGIVTMEDILEELVGEIWDEHDEVEEDFEKLDENTYLSLIHI